jgi:hypothetical protein
MKAGREHRVPVTIGDLLREGKALEIGCQNCSRHLYANPHTINLADHVPVPDAASG